MSVLALRRARPCADDILLLRAALLDGDAARSAYRSWITRHDPRTVEMPALALLPPLSRNLRALGIADEYTPALDALWLRSWTANMRLFRAATVALGVLEDAGLQPVLLKGAALMAGGVITDAGTRVMGDVDILVPFHRAEFAADTLRVAGWSLVSKRSFAEERQRGHSTAFADTDGHQIDLHWRASFDPNDDSALLARTVPATLEGIKTRIPSPADQLVLTCLHGVGWHGAPLRWIADSVLLLLHHPDLDWDVFRTEARARKSSHRLASQLELLNELMSLNVLTSVIVELRRDRLTLTERLLQRARESEHWGTSIYACSWDHARRSRKLTEPVAESWLTFAMIDLGFTRRRQLLGRVLTQPLCHLRWIARGRTWD